MTRCRIPNFCERYKKDIGIYDVKINRILLRNIKQDVCVHIHKTQYCVIWKKKKNRNNALLKRVEEIERIFK